MKSPLRRIGNKARLLPSLLKLFPDKIKAFVDMFMGTGNVAFAMAKRCQYVFANDIDNDVYNLWSVIKEGKKEELIQRIAETPVHQHIFNEWKNKQEADPVWKAARFLYLSNYSYLGQCGCIKIGDDCSKRRLLKTLTKTNVFNIKFLNCDFREVLTSISFTGKYLFVYADPPYLQTSGTYDGFTKQDTTDLFALLIDSGYKFGISEFPHPFVLELAEKHSLFITKVCERKTLKNRNVEIYISNYDPQMLKQKDIFKNQVDITDKMLYKNISNNP
jgi:DNA adenine methylase